MNVDILVFIRILCSLFIYVSIFSNVINVFGWVIFVSFDYEMFIKCVLESMIGVF